MINETVEKYLGEGAFKDMAIDVADDMNDLLAQNWNSVDVSKEIAKKYKLTVKKVNQAYKDSYGMWPSDYE